MKAGVVRALGAALTCAALGAAADHVYAQSLTPSSMHSFVVAPELWDRPRSGAAVMEQPAIRQAVSTLLARPGARLVVHHGAGQEPYAQAEELRTWLIALAIEGGRVLLRNDPGPAGPLRLEVLSD
jgi:hypothetical protein